uniref:hypothetical protein n=1 Tax=Burkholderia arboris TaxID=488730 RepID=UPI003BEF1A09
MSAADRRRSRLTALAGATWTRGYLGHVYRDASGNALGRVRRSGRPCVEYLWQTGHARASAPDLATAKRLVELTVARTFVQRDLFDTNECRRKPRAPVWATDPADAALAIGTNYRESHHVE